MTDHRTTDQTALHDYIALHDTYYRIYERYQVDASLAAQLREARPAAHVVVASQYACPDCARNVPRMARIAEGLPGWTWDVFDSISDGPRKVELAISRIPTFIVYEEEGGRELGRIVENPASGSLAEDLLRILRSA